MARHRPGSVGRQPTVRAVIGFAFVALIAVAAFGCESSEPVVVTPIPPTLSLTPAQLELGVGETGRFQVTTAGLDNGDRVVWTSSAAEIARVIQSGSVLGVAAGEATITAALPGTEWRVSARVTVSDAP